MDHCRKIVCAALALASLMGTASADESAPSGREVFERRCRICHGGTARAEFQIGPSLAGIIGKKAATQDSAVHSRSMIDSGIVWDRDSLRRFLADPSRAIPGTLMAADVTNPAELESLLDYLESLR